MAGEEVKPGDYLYVRDIMSSSWQRFKVERLTKTQIILENPYNKAHPFRVRRDTLREVGGARGWGGRTSYYRETPEIKAEWLTRRLFDSIVYRARELSKWYTGQAHSNPQVLVEIDKRLKQELDAIEKGSK